MKIQTGHFDLFDIYTYVARHPRFVSGINRDMRDYTKLVGTVMDGVPKQAGWYLWGRFNNVGFWETIYLGKAGNLKTSSLYARLREELLDERAAFWATLYGAEPTERQFQKIYKNKYGPGTRTYRKCGAHYIVWVSADGIDEDGVKAEEQTLITLYRPTANIQRVRYPEHTEHTERVLKRIDAEIRRVNER